MTERDRPEPVTRPNGKTYRPQRLTAYAVTDEYEILCGVIVLGTHDQHRAQPMADDYACWQLGAGYAAVNPLPGWYRDGFDGGSRRWVTDEAHGRAGVWFREIAETAEGSRP
jgi:hypothetical protein